MIHREVRTAGKEKKKPEEKLTSFTGGKMQGVERAHRTGKGQDAEHGVSKHILGEVHKSLQTLAHILH